MSQQGVLAITQGSTNYAFALYDEEPNPQVTVKPVAGELQRQSGALTRDSQIDAPWSIMQATGIGEARNREYVQGGSRVYDERNVQTYWTNFLVCLGPKKQTPTQSALPSTYKVTQGAGFLEANGYFIVYGDASAGTNGEPAYYFATTTWTNCTLNADLTADVENITGMTYAEGYWWAVADQLQSDGANNRITYKCVGTSTPTAWERANTNAGDEGLGTTPFTPDRARFLVYSAATRISPVAARLYTILWASASNRAMLSMRATTDGASWDDGAAQEMESSSTPRGLTLFAGEDGATDVVASTNVALYRGDVSGGAQLVEELYRFENPSGSYTGALCVHEGYLYFIDGPLLKRFRWLDGSGRREVDIFTLNVPGAAQGDFTAVGPARDMPWIWVTRGGLAASHNARVYLFNTETGKFHCPYYNSTAQRAILGLVEFSGDLHIAEETAAGGDQDLFYFVDVNRNPSETASYAHAATGGVVLPKDARGLPEVSGAWRKVEAIGTGLTANNKITDVFASADAAALDMDGSWGTTLGEITASAGSQNFSATPAGTGQSARSMQVKIDLEGASDASPYVEAVNIYVQKAPLAKFVRRFVIDVAATAKGTVYPVGQVIADLEALLTTVTDLSVTYGALESATAMMPVRDQGSALSYIDPPGRSGTVGEQSDVKLAVLTLVDV